MMRTLILLPLAALTLAAADPWSPEVVLARMRQAQSSVESLTARLEQVKSYPQLGIEDPPERGTFTMARTKRGTTRVRMEIQEPETRILTVADGKYLLYQPRIKQAVEGKASGGGKKGLFSGILTGSPEALEELERDYRVERVGETVVSEANVIELRFTARANAVVYCQPDRSVGGCDVVASRAAELSRGEPERHHVYPRGREVERAARKRRL